MHVNAIKTHRIRYLQATAHISHYIIYFWMSDSVMHLLFVNSSSIMIFVFLFVSHPSVHKAGP